MTDDNQIWVVDDDNSIRWVIEKALSGDNIACKTFETADELLGALEHDSPKAIISDIRMPGMDGLTLLRELKAIAPDTPVIITTAHSDLDSAVTSYESGAFEYLPKPFDIDEMLEVASRALAYTQKETIDQAIECLNCSSIASSGRRQVTHHHCAAVHVVLSAYTLRGRWQCCTI